MASSLDLDDMHHTHPLLDPFWLRIIRDHDPDIVDFGVRLSSTDSEASNENLNYFYQEEDEEYVDEFVDPVLESILRDSAEEDETSTKRLLASSLALYSLPIVAVDEAEVDYVCVVCREDEIEDPAVNRRKLPCGHVYHEGCIFTWLRSSNSCPICRFELPIVDHPTR